MKKIAIVAISILIALLAVAYYHFSGQEYIVKIPEAKIQRKLEEKLPLTKTYFYIIQVTLKNPRVHLENGSKKVSAGLDVEFDITLAKGKGPLRGSVDVSGGVRYAAEKKQFFLTDPAIENLAVQGIADKYTTKINQALTRALTEYYKTNPIYTIRFTDRKQAAARMLLKNVIIEHKELVITLGF